ncbi:hypothetical protein HDU82_008993 [Entophlyctis luteolus]|nr:hypothetical protein HDU82_008993 [Entophlyctis luteolus]
MPTHHHHHERAPLLVGAYPAPAPVAHTSTVSVLRDVLAAVAARASLARALLLALHAAAIFAPVALLLALRSHWHSLPDPPLLSKDAVRSLLVLAPWLAAIATLFAHNYYYTSPASSFAPLPLSPRIRSVLHSSAMQSSANNRSNAVAVSEKDALLIDTLRWWCQHPASLASRRDDHFAAFGFAAATASFATTVASALFLFDRTRQAFGWSATTVVAVSICCVIAAPIAVHTFICRRSEHLLKTSPVEYRTSSVNSGRRAAVLAELAESTEDDEDDDGIVLVPTLDLDEVIGDSQFVCVNWIKNTAGEPWDFVVGRVLLFLMLL